MTVDPRAAAGFAEAADAYQRGRPSYPAPAIEAIVEALDLGETSTVLDLAAGTGKLCALLHSRVGEVIAVEPVAAMRAKLAADLPDVLALNGMAEAIPLPDQSVDAVLVGEAFHTGFARLKPTSYSAAEDAKLDRWPPMSAACLLALATITAAFQRM